LDAKVTRAAYAVADRALGAAHVARQRHRDVYVLDLVAPGRGDDVPQEHRRRRRRRTHAAGEGLVGTGGAGVEHPGNGVADLVDVGAVAEVLVRIADLGYSEAAAVLPEHLVRGGLTVDQDRGDLRLLPHPRAVLVGDVPVPEDAVAPAGKFGGDGLHGVEPAVVVDDEVRLVVAEDHRVRDVGRLRAAAEHERP
jgi:hypothetical protein